MPRGTKMNAIYQPILNKPTGVEMYKSAREVNGLGGEEK